MVVFTEPEAVEVEAAYNNDKGKVERIDLPSGGWWAFYVPTKRNHIRRYSEFMKGILTEDTNSMDLISSAVMYCTHDWSFSALPQTVDSYDDMIDIQDANAAEVFFTDRILPLANPTTNRS